MEPKVTIIILHLDSIPCLVNCIMSLNKINYSNFSVHVVHNDRDNPLLLNNLSAISDHISGVTNTGYNTGFARGNNVGIKKVHENDFDYVLLLNDDTEVSIDFLSILVDEAEKRPDTGMLGPMIHFFEEPEKIWFAEARFNTKTCMLTTPRSDQLNEGTDSEPIESDYITGCALLINKAVIEKIGLLDERFFLYWEDVDWGLRAKKAGFKNVVIPAAHIRHKVSVSSGGMDSLIRVYHKTRSHLLMARLHAPKALPKLHVQFFRDIAWLLFKSKDVNRFKKAHAFIAAIRDYHIGKAGQGPDWLWSKK